MKNKVQDVLFIISITYSIIIVILMLYSYSTSTNILKFNDESDNIEILNEYKEELKNIKENNCKKSVKSLVDYYEKTSYNGMINLKDKYFSDDNLLSYALLIFNDCNLDEDLKNSLSTKFIAASIQFDEVLQSLYFQYEIRIPDIKNRLIAEPNLDNIRYTINRKTQLEIIGTLVNTLKEEA